MTPKMQQAREAWREKQRAKLLNDRTGDITLDDICAHMWNAAIEAAEKAIDVRVKNAAARARRAEESGDSLKAEIEDAAYMEAGFIATDVFMLKERP